MTRGPKNHLKRLNAPKHWMLEKLGGIYAPKPSSGPHKERQCLPLIVILRNRLKYALNRKEVQAICTNKLVQVDGKVRTDMNYPAGFMDVLSLPKSNDTFRLLYNTKGRFVLHNIDQAEAQYKLCRVVKQDTTKRAVPYIVTHDGRTIRYADPDIKVHDTVKVDIATGKVVDFVKFATGNVATVTNGRNTGRAGVVLHRDRHPGSFDIVHIRDAAGNEFATRLANVFMIGKGDDVKSALVSFPRGRGIKKDIFENRDEMARRLKN